MSLKQVVNWINTGWSWFILLSLWSRRKKLQCPGIGVQHQRHSCAPTWLLPSSQGAIRKKINTMFKCWGLPWGNCTQMCVLGWNLDPDIVFHLRALGVLVDIQDRMSLAKSCRVIAGILNKLLILVSQQKHWPTDSWKTWATTVPTARPYNKGGVAEEDEKKRKFNLFRMSIEKKCKRQVSGEKRFTEFHFNSTHQNINLNFQIFDS